MSDGWTGAGARPPSQGWYALSGNPNDLAYFDGRFWTWRRQRDATGEWQQRPIVPPTPTSPLTAPPGPAGFGARPPIYPGFRPHPPSDAGWWRGPPRHVPPGHLDLHLPEPQRQARWRTLLRGLLVLPNMVALGFLEVAVYLVTILMWFAALFTARVPEDLWRFSVGILKWQTRTYAFAFFLSDRFPPFATGDAPYPVAMTIGGPSDRFNRLSVLFRAVLVVPAWIVMTVFGGGVELLSVAAWLTTLIAGRCPRTLHLVIAAWLRYSLRVSAFELLLTTEYPSGPLGDRPTGYGDGSLQEGDIVLTGGSKGLAIGAMVVGVVWFFATSVVPAAMFGTALRLARRQVAVSQIDSLSSRTLAARSRYRREASSCTKITWQCVQHASPIILHSLDTQIASYGAITYPTAKTQFDADKLIAVLRLERSVLARVQNAASKTLFESELVQLFALTARVLALASELDSDLNAVR